MNIGQAAAASGVSAKMIRYYESIALMAPSGRTEAGYRVFSESDLAALRFIRRARGLGFSLEQVGELMSLWRNEARASRDVQRIAAGHVEALNERIAEMSEMRDALASLVSNCVANDRPDCAILRDLTDPARDQRLPPAQPRGAESA